MRTPKCNFFSKSPLARRESEPEARQGKSILAKSFTEALNRARSGMPWRRRFRHVGTTLPALHPAWFRCMGEQAEQKRTNAVTIEWKDLSDDERTALKRMNRGPYPELDPALGERLIALGLAESRPRGIGINRTGRELVIGTLLAARDKDG
jgi:hypothetical protein